MFNYSKTLQDTGNIYGIGGAGKGHFKNFIPKGDPILKNIYFFIVSREICTFLKRFLYI